jgi:hypothetical protein
MLRLWLPIAVIVMCVPSTAAADWLFTPAITFPTGGDTVDQDHPAFGFAVGIIDEESFAFEADLGYAPSFFNGSRADFDGTGNVLTLMGNVLIGAGSGRVIPYVTGGAGYMQMRVTSDFGRFQSTTREAGFNVGGGILGFARQRVGLRADVRYFRSFQNQVPSWTRGIGADIAPGSFDFWRMGVGVTIRTSE